MAEWLDVAVCNKSVGIIQVRDFVVPEEDIEILAEEGFMLPGYQVLKGMLMRIAQHVGTSAGKELWRTYSWCDNFSPYSLCRCFVREEGVVEVIVVPRPIFPPKSIFI